MFIIILLKGTQNIIIFASTILCSTIVDEYHASRSSLNPDQNNLGIRLGNLQNLFGKIDFLIIGKNRILDATEKLISVLEVFQKSTFIVQGRLLILHVTFINCNIIGCYRKSQSSALLHLVLSAEGS